MELKIINISYDLDVDGLYSVFFEYENGYFCLSRNLDEDDEEVYLEKDEQNDAVYIYPNKIKYTIDNSKVEFLIDKNIDLKNFSHHWVLHIEFMDVKQYSEIEQVLIKIFGSVSDEAQIY